MSGENLWSKFLESLHAAIILACVALIGFLAAAAWHLDRALVQLRLTEQKFADSAIVMGGAARDMELTLRKEQDAAGTQIAATTDTLRQAQKDLADLDVMIVKLNGTTDALSHAGDSLQAAGIAATNAITEQQAHLATLEQQAGTNLQTLNSEERQIAPILDNTQQATAAAARLLADPANLDSLHQADAALDQAHQSLANVNHATADLAAAIHRETRPASFTVRLAGWIVDGATKAGAIIGGLF